MEKVGNTASEKVETTLIFINWPALQLQAEIVEKTFVISRFSDIRKETTLFLVVPKKPTRNDARLVSDLKNTRPGTTRNEPINGGKLG